LSTVHTVRQIAEMQGAAKTSWSLGSRI